MTLLILKYSALEDVTVPRNVASFKKTVLLPINAKQSNTYLSLSWIFILLQRGGN